MKWLNHMVLTLQSLTIVFLEDLPRYSLIQKVQVFLLDTKKIL